MDPFSYVMGLMAVQSVQRQFEEGEPQRRTVSKARATRRRAKLRRLANRVVARRGTAPATEHLRAQAGGRE
jgi:hypothetical protein